MRLKWDNQGIKTPLARVRGLGASHAGTGRWIALRLTSIAGLLLSIWFVWFVKAAVPMSHEAFVAFLAQPVNALAMILFVVAMAWHACLGCREIVEDYIHSEGLKLVKIGALYLFFFAGGVAGVFGVLKIAMAG